MERTAARLEAAESDLRRLADGVRRRPQIVQLAQASTQEASLESVGSVGLRLAYQLERMLDAQVVVTAYEGGEPAEDGTEARGRCGSSASRDGGTGGCWIRCCRRTATSRGSREATWTPSSSKATRSAGRCRTGGNAPERCWYCRCGPASGPWVASRSGRPEGESPSGGVRAEILAALGNAGPRVVTALEADRLKEKTRLDPLTGLLNRRGLDAVLNRVDVGDGAVIYADLDRFKDLNDKLGHPAGDAALIHFARIIREQVRNGDVGARIGGEEFAIWLPAARLDVGFRIAERIRIKLNTTQWDWRGRAWPLSASFGVSACPETSREVGDLIPQADAALYVAKNSGRNRVERAGQRGGAAAGR